MPKILIIKPLERLMANLMCMKEIHGATNVESQLPHLEHRSCCYLAYSASTSTAIELAHGGGMPLLKSFFECHYSANAGMF